MTITEDERRKLLADYEAKKKRELSDRMRRLGRTKSPKKRAAVLKNLKKAQAVRWGKKPR